MLYFIYVFLFISFVFLLFIPSKYVLQIRIYVLLLSLVIFFFFLFIWFFFNMNTTIFQYCFSFSILFQFGLDGLNLLFVLLTTSLFPLLILNSWTIQLHVKLLYSCLFLIEYFLIIVFSVLDIFTFYIFFELILIPMILIIGIWGSRSRKIKAAFYFFLYTFFGSLFMLIGLIIIYYEIGTTNLILLNFISWTSIKERLLWCFFALSFIIKIPMFPFHIWLPEAHVEAPTVGSVLLAGLLLKLGSYGFLRILLPLSPFANLYFTPLILMLSLLGVIYASLVLLCQIDIKKIIAYSSIAHMNYGLLGLFSGTLEGLEGGLFLMISHGFSSSGLFLIAGILYDRYHTRLVHYYGGLLEIMPIFSFFFFFFTLANFGFPGTANFIGEFLVILGLYNKLAILMGFVFVGLFFSLIYSILLYNRICCGELNIYYLIFNYNSDLTWREFILLIPLFFFICVFGIWPSLLLNLMQKNLFFFFFFNASIRFNNYKRGSLDNYFFFLLLVFILFGLLIQ